MRDGDLVRSKGEGRLTQNCSGKSRFLTQNLCSDETPNPELFRFIKFIDVVFRLEIYLFF